MRDGAGALRPGEACDARGALGSSLGLAFVSRLEQQTQDRGPVADLVWVEERRGSKLSKKLPATGVIFRETEAEHNVDWHPAPRRQYIVNLDAGVKLTASDGESRFIAAGEIILVEDTTGKGHLSDHIENKIRHSIFIPIE